MFAHLFFMKSVLVIQNVETKSLHTTREVSKITGISCDRIRGMLNGLRPCKIPYRILGREDLARGYLISPRPKRTLNLSNSRLTLLRKSENSHLKAVFLCICGKEVEAMIRNVVSGNTKSCGCLRDASLKKSNSSHGLTNHPLYNIWCSMKSRCYNKKNRNYNRYGAVGITVCEEWINDFMCFYDWCIQNGWELGMVIDKDIKAKSLGVLPVYSPKNCSIVTHKENMQEVNKTRIKKLSAF